MEKRSLGLIETWGYAAAVEAADAGAKAANVKLEGYELTPAGYIAVKFLGDVGAVKAAVSAAAAAAAKVGKVVATHVIPRPHQQVGTTIFPEDLPPESRFKVVPEQQPAEEAPPEPKPPAEAEAEPRGAEEPERKEEKEEKHAEAPAPGAGDDRKSETPATGKGAKRKPKAPAGAKKKKP